MSKYFSSSFKLGILGGGQLGKMLIQAGSCFDLNVVVLDGDPNCSAAHLANTFCQGSLKDFDDVYNFGKSVNLLTIEIEHINIDALLKLKAEGLKIHPDPLSLEIICDKGKQKEFYYINKLPTAKFQLLNNKDEVLVAIEEQKIKFPFVQKSRKDGYDGRGVVVIKNNQEISKLFDTACVIEEAITIDKEIAVIVARNESGEIKAYEPVEMEFDENANLVKQLICPADIGANLKNEAIDLAKQVVEKLNICGLLAVEMFLTKSGEILINEVAPRPHNSGHHTIESSITSQYEQHFRGILNLPLGSTKQVCPAIMINLLGEEGYSGPVYYEGLNEVLKIEGVKIHIYGKKETRPFRKMGHITIIDNCLDNAKEKANKIRSILTVKSI